MRAYDLLEKKKRGEALSQEELHFLIDGYVQGEIPDYQMAAFLMAVCLRGMTDQETEAMTQIMRASGAQIDLQPPLPRRNRSGSRSPSKDPARSLPESS